MVWHDGLAGFKIDRAVDIQTVPPTTLLYRKGHLFGRPAAKTPYSRANHAPTACVVRGSAAVIQVFRVSCCATVVCQRACQEFCVRGHNLAL